MKNKKIKNKIRTPVFYDPKNKRWKFSIFFFVIIIGIFSVLLSTLVISIARDYPLPELSQQSIHELVNPAGQERVFPIGSLTIPDKNLEDVDGYIANLPIKEEVELEKEELQTRKSDVIAFLVNWDTNSFFSLKENLDHIDVVMPGWVRIKSSDGGIALNDRSMQIEVTDYIMNEKPTVEIIPVINNYNQEKGDWDPDLVVSIIEKEDSRRQLIENLYEYITINKFSGINVSFEGIPLEDQTDLHLFIKELNEKFKKSNLKVVQSLPIDNDAINYAGAIENVDYLVLLAYDEHWATSVPGPLASHNWFSQALYKRYKELSPSKIVIALGSYGYDWQENDTVATSISYQETMNLIERSGGELAFSEATLSSYYKYTDAENVLHEIWFQDAVSIFNQVHLSSQINPRGYAIWRLGSEDPSVWDVLENRDNLNKESALKLIKIPTGYGINYTGHGEVLKISSAPKTGTRKITYSEELGLILNQEVIEFSSPYVIERSGAGENKKVSLTFDDGPHSKYTPQILEILKEKDVKASFFVIGTEIEKNPGIFKQIVEEGHEVGNHTFTHPDISKISAEQLRLELNATQKLAESLTGRNMLLFRAPYGRDSEPATYREIEPLVTVGEHGYYSVVMKIDPKDYEEDHTSEQIVNNAMSDINDGLGSVILLHDGGGNREETVKALPQMIDTLHEQGYEFVLISDLLGVEKETIMPVSPAVLGTESIINEMTINRFSFSFIGIVSKAIGYFLAIGLVIGILRLISIIILAIIQKRKVKKEKPKKIKHYPTVSIIVPAYNEGILILKSIETALETDYPNYDIIVIDDGSSDDTFEIAKKGYGKHPKVKVLGYKDNRGKSTAVNYGLKNSKSKYVVILDADTLLHKEAITHLVRRIRDRKIGAVAGNIKVGNRKPFLGKIQALEYITSQNLERRAADLLDCITIVPGAIGIWQRGLVKKAGGFNSLTLAEDSEVTLRIHKLGYRVAFEEKAVGYTEAPESYKSFNKQRFRWMFGQLQIVRMHWDMLFNVKYGFVGMYALPAVFLFQIIFTFLAPLFDLIFLFTIFRGITELYFHPDTANIDIPVMLLPYILFLVVDLVVAIIALLLERDEDFKLVVWVPLQRIVYRWSYYFIAYKAFYTAIKGPKVDWGKFERTATAGIPNQ